MWRLGTTETAQRMEEDRRTPERQGVQAPSRSQVLTTDEGARGPNERLPDRRRSRRRPPDPRVVAEGATNRVIGDKAWLSEQYGWRGAIQEGIEWLTYSITDVLTDADPPIALRDAVAEAAPDPALLIAAGNVAAERHAARYIASASPETVEVWVVPDTGHTGALDTHPAEWEQRVTAFLDDALDVDEGAEPERLE